MAAKADRVDLLQRTLSGSEVSRPAAIVRPAGCRLRNLVSETYPPAGVDTSLNRHTGQSRPLVLLTFVRVCMRRAGSDMG
jgi:hypothetical protein